MSLTETASAASAPKVRSTAGKRKSLPKARVRKADAKPAKAPRPRKVAKRRVKKAPVAKPVAATPAAPTTWTGQFITAGADGRVHVSLMTFAASGPEAARSFAAAHAPAEEFMLSVHPCSDEQLLEQVRPQTLRAATGRR